MIINIQISYDGDNQILTQSFDGEGDVDLIIVGECVFTNYDSLYDYLIGDHKRHKRDIKINSIIG